MGGFIVVSRETSFLIKTGKNFLIISLFLNACGEVSLLLVENLFNFSFLFEPKAVPNIQSEIRKQDYQ